MSMLLNRCCEAELWCFYFQALVKQGREERAHGIMGEVQGWGTVCVFPCVCVCVFYTVCSRYECLDLCVSREVYWEEGNEYWLRINAPNLLIENVNCTVNGINVFVHLHVFQCLDSPCVKHDAKYGSRPHSCTHLLSSCYHLVCSIYTSFMIFSPVLCVCLFLFLSVFLLQTVVVSILVERQCGSELGGECSQG